MIAALDGQGRQIAPGQMAKDPLVGFIPNDHRQ
jgi:hypothetical protein